MPKIESFWRSNQGDSKNIQEEINEGIEDVFDEKPEEETDEMIGLRNTNDFFEQEGEKEVDKIYEDYSKAISRRKREPLESDRFFNHFFGESSTEQNYMFGDKKQGYILGIVRHGVFIPTHFAPKGLKGGYNLMKELGKSLDIPSVMAITDDLAETLKKMPEWHNTEMTFPMNFRGEIHQKHIFHNSHPQINELLPPLLQDYINETRDYNNDYDEDYE